MYLHADRGCYLQLDLSQSACRVLVLKGPINRFGGTRSSEVAMKTTLLIVLTAVVLGVGSTLAIMNNWCKSSHHAWCAPTSDIRHHTKTRLGYFPAQN